MGTKSKTDGLRLRVSWWNSQRELYAYVIRPAVSNNCEVAVLTKEKILDGPVVNKTLPELLSLAEIAQRQVAALPSPAPVAAHEIERVIVSYHVDGKKTFSLQGSAPDLLKAIHQAPALEEFLFLLSRNQPKSFRMLDEPRPGGPFMTPPSTDNRWKWPGRSGWLCCGTL